MWENQISIQYFDTIVENAAMATRINDFGGFFAHIVHMYVES